MRNLIAWFYKPVISTFDVIAFFIIAPKFYENHGLWVIPFVVISAVVSSILQVSVFKWKTKND